MVQLPMPKDHLGNGLKMDDKKRFVELMKHIETEVLSIDWGVTDMRSNEINIVLEHLEKAVDIAKPITYPLSHFKS